MSDTEWVHRILDGEAGEGGPGRSEQELARYRSALSLLAESRPRVPQDLAERILSNLPEHPAPRWTQRLAAWVGRSGRWGAPALAGALVTLLLVFAFGRLAPTPHSDRVTVTFELRAPQAHKVELVGSFNDWRPGEIDLSGPDATGHWTTTVELPAGRYEYLFLVDGKEWRTDPKAAAHRPDGFGHENALIEL